MYAATLLFVTALFLSLVLTPLVRAVALRIGLVDRPDNFRKVHSHPVPRAGGVSVWLSYVGTFLILLHPHFGISGVIQSQLPLLWNVLPAAGIVFGIGFVDDFWGVKPWLKLLAQVAAGLLVCFNDVRILGIAGYSTGSFLGVLLTVFWLVMCSNAFNLIDGLDGLAAGIGLFATVTTLTASLINENVGLAVVTIPLAATLLGFLRYNFNPASIFLGDCGSMVIGFLLGCFGVIWSNKSATLAGITAPILAMSVPLVDTGLAVARRYLRLQPIFQADRDHVHHRLLARGLTPRDVTLVIYALCFATAVLSLIQNWLHERFSGTLLLVFAVAACCGIQRLNYSELNLIGRAVAGGQLRRMLFAQLRLRALERALVKAETIEECWQAIRDAGETFGLESVRLCVGGKAFEEHWDNLRREPCWSARIQISTDDFMELRTPIHVRASKPPLSPLFYDLVLTRMQLGWGPPAIRFVAPPSSDKPIPVPVEPRSL